MKRLVIAAIAMLTLVAATANAADTMGGLGFHTLNGAGNVLNNAGIGFGSSPTIGIRHWFSGQAGIDLGVGFTSVSAEASPPTTKLDEGTGYAVDIGIPWALKKWDKVNFIFRPGFLFASAKATDKLAVGPPDELTNTLMSVSGELEVEVFLVDKVSISASHGLAYSSFKQKINTSPEAELKATGFNTTGDNFTSLGFHVYLW